MRVEDYWQKDRRHVRFEAAFLIYLARNFDKTGKPKSAEAAKDAKKKPIVVKWTLANEKKTRAEASSGIAKKHTEIDVKTQAPLRASHWVAKHSQGPKERRVGDRLLIMLWADYLASEQGIAREWIGWWESDLWVKWLRLVIRISPLFGGNIAFANVHRLVCADEATWGEQIPQLWASHRARPAFDVLAARRTLAECVQSVPRWSDMADELLSSIGLF